MNACVEQFENRIKVIEWKFSVFRNNITNGAMQLFLIRLLFTLMHFLELYNWSFLWIF